MNNPTALSEEIGTAAAPTAVAGARTPRPHDVLVLSLWCGLVAGLLEVGAIVLRKHTADLNQFYWMSRFFVWMIPLTNLLLFLGLGLVLAMVSRIWPRRGGGISARLLCAMTLLPLIWTVLPRIYGPAGFLLVLGIATWLVPVLERHAAGFRQCVRWGFPVLAGLIALPAASIWAGDRFKEWREEARPLPAPGSLNVLLIVLDTVAADHLSLHGYSRPTCPTLEGLTRRGIRFDRARRPPRGRSPLTPASSRGVGPTSSPRAGSPRSTRRIPRWPSISRPGAMPRPGSSPICPMPAPTRGWNAASRATRTTSSRSSAPSSPRRWSTGRSRGCAINQILWNYLGLDLLTDWLQPFYAGNRKPATAINREFLDWLSGRRQPERPFFAFLNFMDAHYPYKLPDSSVSRFGGKPHNEHEKDLIDNWQAWDKLRISARDVALARDAYDDCIADLDEQLGRLIDELERRGILERTWLIVTSDHGESFGVPHNDFGHGTSLYQPQLHVPLIIVPPAIGGRGGETPMPRVVPETVSLRDLPATVVDLLDLEAGAPFPGGIAGRTLEPSRSGRLRRSRGTRSIAGALRGGPDQHPGSGVGEPAPGTIRLGIAGRRGFGLRPGLLSRRRLRGVVRPPHGPLRITQPRRRCGPAPSPRADARDAGSVDRRAAHDPAIPAMRSQEDDVLGGYRPC